MMHFETVAAVRNGRKTHAKRFCASLPNQAPDCYDYDSFDILPKHALFFLLQAVEGFANLEGTLPPGCTTIKFAKVAEAVVFLDDDAQLDTVVDEAEMEAAALDVRFFSVSHTLVFLFFSFLATQRRSK
jgi:hypothetical protein